MRRKGILSKVLIVLAVVLVVLILIAGVLFFLGKKNKVNLEAGAADAQTAFAVLKDMGGDSYVETLADLSKAKKQPDPQIYLAENSVFVMDDEAVEITVASQIAGAESTAESQGITYEELIVDTWGYESIDAYKIGTEEEVIQFIKERLCIYKVAEKENITISEEEYQNGLESYAAKFGFSSVEAFTYACTPATIASEMLYDKTLEMVRE